MNRTGPRVLIADDDAAARVTTAEILRAAGLDVSEAADGEAAVVMARTSAFDVALLDVSMPGVDGFEVQARLAAVERPPTVLFLTARAGRADVLHGLYAGAADYIAKPFDADLLVARVEAAARLRAALDEARAETRIDPLTGIANRRSFDRSLPAEFARAARYGHPLALLFIDVDGLKAFNDTHGHYAGDELLRAVARVLQATCRDTDRPSRIGGDEFAAILPETNRPNAGRFADRLRAALAAERFPAGGAMRSPAASLGLAVYPDDAPDEKGLRRAADEALYEAKRARMGAASTS